MTIVEQIKAEIERLKTVQLKRIQEGDLVDAEPYDKFEAYDELLDFLDTLESEKPMQEGLEEEIQVERKKLIEAFGPMNGEQVIAIKDFARHFAKWGAVHANDESEKPVPNDAKEAAKEYARCHYADTFSQELAENDFLAGSAWKEMRMLKEAVEGEVDFEYFGYKVIRPDLKQLDTLLESMNHGDNVRIIIVKED